MATVTHHQPDSKTDNPLLKDPPTSKIIKIAVGGGKGGVGKTLMALLLGIFFAFNEKKVILIDMDFAGPDLNRLVGVKEPEKNLNYFFLKQNSHLKNLLMPTPLESLHCIFNAQNPGLISNFQQMKKRFCRQLNELEKEVIIFDLSSTQFEASVELFLLADFPVLVTNSEATAIRQSFSFLKACIIHLINAEYRFTDSIQKELEQCQLASHKQFPVCLKKIINRIKIQNQAPYDEIMKKLSAFRPHFLFNMARNQQLLREQMALQLAAEESLGIKLKYLGNLEFISELRKIFRSPNIFRELSLLTTKYANLKEIAERLFQKPAANSSLMHFKNVLRQSVRRLNLSEPEKSNNEIICSNQCPYWEKCQMRRGGYVCRVEYIGFLCQKRA